MVDKRVYRRLATHNKKGWNAWYNRHFQPVLNDAVPGVMKEIGYGVWILGAKAQKALERIFWSEGKETLGHDVGKKERNSINKYVLGFENGQFWTD